MYWRCPSCGGPTVMEMVCEKCLKREEACTTATVQTSKNIKFNNNFIYYTTKGANCQHAMHDAP